MAKTTGKSKPKPKTQIDLDELAELSGERNVRRVKYTVPILKFNGNTGQFTLLTSDKNGNLVPDEKGDNVKGVILRVRRAYSSYEKIEGGSSRMFTNEHNSSYQNLVLFEKSSLATRTRFIDSGSIDKLRKINPNLKLRHNLYFLFEDQVVKLGVRGKSLGSLFEYYNSFSDKEHLFEYFVKISCHEETNEGGLTYYVMDFIRGEKSDLEVVAPMIKDVATKLEAQDQSQAAASRSRDENSDQSKTPEEDISTRSSESEQDPNAVSTNDSEESKEERIDSIPF